MINRPTMNELLHKYYRNDELTLTEIHWLIIDLNDMKMKLKSEFYERALK